MAKKIICNCGSNNLTIDEIWKDHSIQFDQENGEIKEGHSLEVGYPYKIEATCKLCGRNWRVRGATQITDIC